MTLDIFIFGQSQADIRNPLDFHPDHQLIHRHLLHLVAFRHFVLTPFFLAQKKVRTLSYKLDLR